MAIGTQEVRGWHLPEPAVVDRREGETTAGGVTGGAAGLASGRPSRMKNHHDRWCSGDAHNGVVVVAIRASLARDLGRLMVDKPTDERRRVVAVAAIGSRQQIIMQSRRGLTDGTESIVTRLTRDGVPRQDTMIENTAQVETGGVVAGVTGLSNEARQRVRMRRRILAGNLRVGAIVAAVPTAGARCDGGVIHKRGIERRRGVTGIAFHRNTWMPIGSGIGANRDSAIVTGRTDSSDTRVIERSVRIERQEMVSRVAIATFLCGNEVSRRFPDDGKALLGIAIMTTATATGDFVVINKVYDSETCR